MTITAEDTEVAGTLTGESTLAEWLAHPVGGPILRSALTTGPDSTLARSPEILQMVESMPLARVMKMGGGHFDIEQLLDEVHRAKPVEMAPTVSPPSR